MTGQGSSPDRSRYQQGIVRRAYEHKDTIALRRLSEIVSDLYLAEGGQKRKLWESAKLALAKLAPNDPRAQKALAKKDVEELARLVTKLSAVVKATPPASTTGTVRDGESETDAKTASDDVAARGSTGASAPVSVSPPPAPEAAHAAGADPDDPPSPEMLKRAMKMFRKRLKLKKLDDESKLGRNPLTGGKSSAVIAIMAPREFPPAVWEELARQGKLRHAGGSFYELAE